MKKKEKTRLKKVLNKMPKVKMKVYYVDPEEEKKNQITSLLDERARIDERLRELGHNPEEISDEEVAHVAKILSEKLHTPIEVAAERLKKAGVGR